MRKRVPRRRRAELLEIAEKIARALIAIGWILLQQLADALRCGGRKRCIEWNERLGLRIANFFEHHQRGFGVERQPSGGHLVENDADRKQIAALIRGLSARLLGREIVKSSEELAGRRLDRERRTVTVKRPCQSKIENLHLA